MDYRKVPLTNAATAAGIYIMARVGTRNVKLGAVISMRENIRRDTTRRFEIDADFPGRTVEIIPGKISTLTLDIDRAVLFPYAKDGTTQNETLGHNIFGQKIYDILYQRSPFDIEKHIVSPSNSNETVITYKDCFISSVSNTINISSDWLIIETANVEVSYVDYNGASML